MPYNPAIAPVREQILAELETTLGNIGPSDYATSVKFVRRWEGNVFQVPQYPAIVIVPTDETSRDDRAAIVEHTMEIALMVAIRENAWATPLNQLLADIRYALTRDETAWTRGGLAVTTRIVSEQVLDSDPSKPVGAAQVNVQVLYRTLYDDPTTPA